MRRACEAPSTRANLAVASAPIAAPPTLPLQVTERSGVADSGRGASRDMDVACEPPGTDSRRPRDPSPPPPNAQATLSVDACRSERAATTSNAPPAMNNTTIDRIDSRESPVTAATMPTSAGPMIADALPIML